MPSLNGRCTSCGSSTDTAENCPNPGCPSKRPSSQFPPDIPGAFFTTGPVTGAVVNTPTEATREGDESIALARLQAVQSRKMGLNRHKGGWRGESYGRLMDLLKAEVAELAEALHTGTPQDALGECADIANFCAFYVDKIMAEHPELIEESDDARWVRRIKLLEARADRAAAVLRGQDE